MKILTVVGARPQFIKAAPISRALSTAGHEEFLVHTGQHYDKNMSETFFEELNISEPDVNLGIGSGSHAYQTGQMLMKIETVIMDQCPDYVCVYGDTNSTLAGALAAAKLNVPVAHVEAGLRSFNQKMPEEINRILTDHLSCLLFCPTAVAVKNLEKEGITQNVCLVGDVMYDSVKQNAERAVRQSTILEKLDVREQSYVLATVHRAENTDDPRRLKNIFNALGQLAHQGLHVILPLHPRTRKNLKSFVLSVKNLHIIDPVAYLDMLNLEQKARVILTDSGGVQKEAYWFGVPCITLRNETEWIETVETGWNTLAGCDQQRIVSAFKSALIQKRPAPVFDDESATQKIVKQISSETVKAKH